MALLGCGKHEPRHIVILPDISGSIDRESLEQAFKAIDELAAHLQRGDKLTIVPILGDADAESSGRILRFEVPANRQAYDTDLRDFRAKMISSLKELQTNATVHPGSKTDILGSVILAEQEFQMDAATLKRVLIILSDFIQEDHELDFRTDKRLKSLVAAQKFALQTRNSDPITLHQIHAYLGLLATTASLVVRKYDRPKLHKLTVRERSNGTDHWNFAF